MSSRKIFDDVLRTIQERLPKLLIPFVNEVFQTSYKKDMEVTRLPESYQKVISKVVADSCSRFGEQIYHFECQSRKDGSMILRMVEYDFMIGLVDSKSKGRGKKIQFPRSCILYLRSPQNMMEEEELVIEFADGQQVKYRVPILKLRDYSIDEIFEKDLLILLPYYIIKYEKELSSIEKDEKKIEILVAEYSRIIWRMEEQLKDEEMGLRQDLLQLMHDILDYLLEKKPILKERMDDVMGGKVLSLPSDALREARAEGKMEGKIEGKIEGKMQTISALVETCQELGASREDVVKKIIEKLKISMEEAEIQVAKYWK